MFPGSEFDIDRALSARRPVNQLRQRPIPIRANDKVDLGNTVQQAGPQALGHAADHTENASGTLMALQLSYPAVYALLGLVPNGTRVHQDDIGICRRIRHHVSVAAQQTQYQLGVGHIHLAAVGLHIDPFHHLAPANSAIIVPSASRRKTAENR